MSDLFPLPPLAEVPLLDWSGPAFLKFYAAAFVVAFAWSWLRIRSARSRCELPQSPQSLTDPYDLAYLAGGARRVEELLMIRLTRLGVARWVSSGARLQATGSAPLAPLDPLEQSLMHHVEGKRENGLRAIELKSHATALASRVETRVAAKGLRPSASDLATIGSSALLPLQMLAGLGVIKILIGLARERPVSFLFIGVAVTVVTIFQLSKKLKRPGLTPAGQKLLTQARQEHLHSPRVLSEDRNVAAWTTVAALAGSMALIGAAEHQELYRWLEASRPIHWGGGSAGGGGTGNNGGGSSGCSTGSSCSNSSCSSSSDSGGSSCSSSSCGSSGCGGCGGGGGD